MSDDELGWLTAGGGGFGHASARIEPDDDPSVPRSVPIALDEVRLRRGGADRGK